MLVVFGPEKPIIWVLGPLIRVLASIQDFDRPQESPQRPGFAVPLEAALERRAWGLGYKKPQKYVESLPLSVFFLGGFLGFNSTYCWGLG